MKKTVSEDDCKHCKINIVGCFNEYWCMNSRHHESFCSFRKQQGHCPDYEQNKKNNIMSCNIINEYLWPKTNEYGLAFKGPRGERRFDIISSSEYNYEKEAWLKNFLDAIDTFGLPIETRQAIEDTFVTGFIRGFDSALYLLKKHDALKRTK